LKKENENFWGLFLTINSGFTGRIALPVTYYKHFLGYSTDSITSDEIQN